MYVRFALRRSHGPRRWLRLVSYPKVWDLDCVVGLEDEVVRARKIVVAEAAGGGWGAEEHQTVQGELAEVTCLQWWNVSTLLTTFCWNVDVWPFFRETFCNIVLVTTRCGNTFYNSTRSTCHLVTALQVLSGPTIAWILWSDVHRYVHDSAWFD